MDISSKRSIAHLLNAEEGPTTVEESRRKRLRLSDLLLPTNEQPIASTSTSTSTSTKPFQEQKLVYPPKTPTNPIKPTPFQQPVPLITFSYTTSRSLEFTDSALRYFVQPPPDAQLSYGYERWRRRPEGKGRVDGLVEAWDKVCREMSGGSGLQNMDVGVVAWRGVITRWANNERRLGSLWSYSGLGWERILTAPYEERDGWEMNVMYINGTMYFEEHLSDAKLMEK
jgi:RAT1-interacting protein